MLKGKTSVQRLEELSFDPIETIIAQLTQLEDRINREMARGPKANDKIIATLLSTKARLMESMLPYSYVKAEKLQENNNVEAKPIRIILEDGNNFNSN